MELDPHWEWYEVRAFGDSEPRWVKGYCNHLDVVPVESSGQIVARLCLTCDAQLPGDDGRAAGRAGGGLAGDGCCAHGSIVAHRPSVCL